MSTKNPKKSSMSLKAGHLKMLLKWLNLPLHGKEARIRNRFIILARPFTTEFEDERLKKLNDLATKDEAGKPKMEADGKTFTLTPEKLEEFHKYMNEIGAEPIVFDLLDSTRPTLLSMKEVLKKIGDFYEFTIEEGALYDEICEAFDPI